MDCHILGFSESRVVNVISSVGGEKPFLLESLPQTHVRTLHLKLPSGKVLDINVSEEDLVVVSAEMTKTLINQNAALESHKND